MGLGQRAKREGERKQIRPFSKTVLEATLMRPKRRRKMEQEELLRFFHRTMSIHLCGRSRRDVSDCGR